VHRWLALGSAFAALAVSACGGGGQGYFLDVSSEVAEIDALAVSASGPSGPLVSDVPFPNDGQALALPARLRVEDGGRNEMVTVAVWGSHAGARVAFGQGSLAVRPGGDGAVSIVLRAPEVDPGCEENLVINPDLEGGDAGWDADAADGTWLKEGHESTRSIRFCARAGATTFRISGDVRGPGGGALGAGTYAMAGWFRAQGGATPKVAVVPWYRGTDGKIIEQKGAPTAVGGDWKRVQGTIDVPANNGVGIRYEATDVKAGDCLDFDDACAVAK